MLFSGWMLAYAIPHYTGVGMGYGMEPKTLPNVVTVIILALSVLQTITSARNLIQNKKKNIKDNEEGVTRSLSFFALMLAGLMGLTVVLMKYVGFLAAGVIFMVLIQLICRQRNWMKLVLLAVGTPLFLKLTFWYGMGIYLPAGILFP